MRAVSEDQGAAQLMGINVIQQYLLHLRLVQDLVLLWVLFMDVLIH